MALRAWPKATPGRPDLPGLRTRMCRSLCLGCSSKAHSGEGRPSAPLGSLHGGERDRVGEGRDASFSHGPRFPRPGVDGSIPVGPLRGVGDSISLQPLGLKRSRALFPTCARAGAQANLTALSRENLQLPGDFETGSPAAEGASAARLAGNRSPREGCATCLGGSVIARRVPSCLRMPVAKGRAGTQAQGSGCCPLA